MMEFEKIYKEIPDKEKLKFLSAIVKHNKSLQQELMNFTKQQETSGKGILLEPFMHLISDTTKQYLDSFGLVDLENPDWDNYSPPHSGYIEDWEQYQQASEQEFERVFEAFKSEAIDKLLQQEIDEFMAMLLGLYEACLNLEVEDEVCSFDDVNDHLANEHKNLMADLVEKIKLMVVSGQKINPAIQLFFEYCDAEYPGNPSFPNYFEPLILALADISDQPGEILSIIDVSKVEREAMPQLVLLLNKNSGNNSDWLKSAQQYYLYDKEVAGQLLDYYFEKDKAAFVKTAQQLFGDDKQYWAGFLQTKVEPELDRPLYVEVFYQLAIAEKEIAHYQKIRTLLSPAEFKQLLLEIRRDKAFAVEILALEKKFDNIKQIVANNPDSWDYEALIRPILKMYPAFCFESIKTKIENTLAVQRGRSTYQRIASLLTLAKSIPGHEPQTHELITRLYKHKPNLPALRDEFRKEGLV